MSCQRGLNRTCILSKGHQWSLFCMVSMKVAVPGFFHIYFYTLGLGMMSCSLATSSIGATALLQRPQKRSILSPTPFAQCRLRSFLGCLVEEGPL